MSSTETVTVPQPGRLYRFTSRTAGVGTREYLVFVTAAEAAEYSWGVTGYRVTRSYQLTDEQVTESGPVGHPYGVRRDAFCGRGSSDDEQIPLYSGRFPASDASQVRAAEHAGCTRYMA